ncbi:glutamic acid-rich protein-like [Periplaneta americana]|uniref:glutamic acid-rich protein-like n=1 Tax=Periplaneta americana TaxID=6978 RepID=UPI0037E99A3A
MPSTLAKLCCFRTRSSYVIYDAANSQEENHSDDLRRSSKQHKDQGKKNRPKSWSVPQIESNRVEQRKERGRKEEDAAKWRSLPYLFANEGLDIPSPTVLFYAKGYDKTKIRINEPDRNMSGKGVSDWRSVIIEASMARDGKPLETSTLKGTKKKAPSPPLSSKKESTVQMFTRIKLDIEKNKKPSNGKKEHVCSSAAMLEDKSLYKENGQGNMIKREENNQKEKEDDEKKDEEKKDGKQAPKSDSEKEDSNKREKCENNKEEEEPMYQPMHLPASARKDDYVHMKNLC